MTVWQAMHALEGLGYRFRATGGGVKAEICGEAPPESSALLDIVRIDREAARAYVVEREAGTMVQADGCTFSLFDALAIGQAVRRGEARLIGKVIFHRKPMTATIHCEDLSALPVWRERLKKALEARLQAMEGRGWENMQAEEYARFCEKYGQYTRLLEGSHDEQQAQGQRRGA